MQITSRPLFLLTVIGASIVTTAWKAGAASANPTLVELWHVGDDALSERLADKLDSGFAGLADFMMSSGRKPGTLIVTIPKNIELNPIGKRARAHYTVEFTSTDGRNLGVRSGSCWEDDLAECVAQIIKNARISARKIH